MTENEELALEVAELNAAIERWRQENDELRADRDLLAARVAKLEAERVVLASERDHYAQRYSAVLEEREQLAVRVAELETHPRFEINPNADLSEAELQSLMKRAAGHACECRGCPYCADYRPIAGSDCACTNRGAR